jgi:hypothetical protein
MAIRDLFEDLDLFRFEPAVPLEIDRHFATATDAELGSELTHVSAAELAALRWLLEQLGWTASGERAPERAIPVTYFDAQLALAKAICTPYYGCQPYRDRQPHLWDVTLFAGDMAKLEGIGLVDPRGLRDDPTRAAEDLEQRYQQSGIDWGRRTAELGYIRLEVLLWATKLSLIENPEGAENEIGNYARSLGLTEPMGAGA